MYSECLAEGTFVLERRLDLRSNVILRGAGPDKTILKNERTAALPEEPNFMAVFFAEIKNAGLEDLTILHPVSRSGDAKSQNYFNGVEIWKCSDCWVDNCRILNCGASAFCIHFSSHITMCKNVVRGRYNDGVGSASVYEFTECNNCLACNETVCDVKQFLFFKCRNSVLYRCYFSSDVSLQFQAKNGVDNLIEGLPDTYMIKNKLVLPESAFGTIFPRKGTALSPGELRAQFESAKEIPMDF
jgi:hypothetical protein